MAIPNGGFLKCINKLYSIVQGATTQRPRYYYLLLFSSLFLVQLIKGVESRCTCALKQVRQSPHLELVLTHTWSWTRCWPIKGTAAPEAGGEIHSDLERGFICAEVFNYNDLATSSLKNLKDAGKIRTEGKTYIVQDGDIVLIRFNV